MQNILEANRKDKTDIAKRLLYQPTWLPATVHQECAEAANEITRLREANEELVDALESLLSTTEYMQWRQTHPVLIKARTAIAKAERKD